MLRLIFRKILNNKWMVACLIIGCTFAIAVAAAIPMYSSGIYNNLLINEFKKQQEQYQSFPFKATWNASLVGIENLESKAIFDELDKIFYEDYLSKMSTDVLFEYKNLTTKIYTMFDEYNYKLKQAAIDNGVPIEKRNLNIKNEFSITASTNTKDMIDLVGGQMFEADAEKNVLQAVVTPITAAQFRLSVGDYYYLYNKAVDEEVVVKIKIVGIVEVNQESSSFFSISGKTFLVDFDQMTNIMNESTLALKRVSWFAAFDYTSLKINDGESIIKVTKVLENPSKDSNIILSSSNNYVQVINTYKNDTKVMQRVFLLLIIPVLLMIAMYVIMISQLMMEREKSEISTLEGRGASRGQIFKIYLGQGIILSIISFVFGVILARWLCLLLGASNGFMEFVNRTAIEVKLNMSALIYAVICATIFLIMILVPAYKASKYSIVQHKQSIADTLKKPFWQVIFLDFILLAMSAYFLYNYESMREYLKNIQVSSIDFTLFIAVVLLIMGLGLLFIRIFPYLVKFIFFLGKKLWKPAAYTAFTNVARGGNYKHFIMIFLILAIGIGIFNANAGRTLNENIKDNIRCSVGADAYIVTAQIDYNGDTGATEFREDTGKNLKNMADKLCKSEYVENYTVVYLDEHNLTTSKDSTVFMGINPYKFGKVVSMRSDLNGGVHINNYLNLLSTYPQGFIISKKIADDYQVKQGEYFNFAYTTFSAQVMLENILVIGVVEYWPGMTTDSFVVMTEDNFSTMKYFTQRGRILIDKKEGILDSVLLEDLNLYRDYDDYITKVSFVDFQLTNAKKDSVLNGMNGILTLDFLISMIICCVGFIIFWIISVRQRVLQFGIFRAMGMKKNELYKMILYEQIMISFVSVIAGIVIGGITSQLFLPLLERMSTLSELYIPFSTYQDGIDYIRVYIVTGLSLFIGLFVLIRFISKLKIDQALKLGED